MLHMAPALEEACSFAHLALRLPRALRLPNSFSRPHSSNRGGLILSNMMNLRVGRGENDATMKRREERAWKGMTGPMLLASFPLLRPHSLPRPLDDPLIIPYIVRYVLPGLP